MYGTTEYGGSANLGVVFKLGTFGYTMLYSFQGGNDGRNPNAGVTLDSQGNLYGTTTNSGPGNAGTVYKLTPSGQETVLYGFKTGGDGGAPYAGVILDSAGNLYGTASFSASQCGVVYKVSPSGQETVLHAFGDAPNDGRNPYAGVISDAAGNLYGTTSGGGAYGKGTVYKLTPTGQETVLYSFGAGGTSAVGPQAGVILDSAGNLYGTASDVVYELEANGAYQVLAQLPVETTGGTAVAGVTRDAVGNLYGTSMARGGQSESPNSAVYKLTPSGQLTVLYTFARGTGVAPGTGVILDAQGNVYGTANGGAGGGGSVYEVSAAGAEETLYTFAPAPGGTTPSGGLIRDAAGNLYGTTSAGGAANDGVVFQVSPAGQETVLHSFMGGVDGAEPTGDLALDSAGNLYGTTTLGGIFDSGVLYTVSPSGQETVLYTFTGGADGAFPDGGVIRDPAGNLFGTTFEGGTANAGVVFKVSPSGQETVMYSFTGGADGREPEAGVTLDIYGRLYGTTIYGGQGDAGVIYRVDSVSQETVLYSFTDGVDGGYPFLAGVIRDDAGNLYGTTVYGGTGEKGVVYELDAAGGYSVLYNFTQGADGENPAAGVVRDPAGNLYGATHSGGTGSGVVYRLSPTGQETVLYTFTGGTDCGPPQAGVILEPSGNICGTATMGGAGGGALYCLTPQ